MWGPRVGEIYAHILDAFVSNNKTHMSRYPPYPCDMKDIKQKLAAATNELIGEGKRFRSARELAQRAHTLGLVPNADSFSRAVARVIKAEHDTQISTAETIARTVGMELTDFLSGLTPSPNGVNRPNTAQEMPLSVQSINEPRVRLIVESLPRMSREILDVVEYLIAVEDSADNEAGEFRRKEVLRNMGLLTEVYPMPTLQDVKKKQKR